MVLSTLRGGWWDAARLYRSWALRQSWVPPRRTASGGGLQDTHVWVRGDTKALDPAVAAQQVNKLGCT